MKNQLYLFLVAVLLWSCATTPENDDVQPVTRIAFGSCGFQDQPQPVLRLAAEQQPDAFVFLGDNIYGDTHNMDTLRNKYGRWMAKPEYQALKDSTVILATWDDHDYGWNDSGRHYPEKEASKAIFLEVFEVPEADERYSRPGIYTDYVLEAGDKKVQIILLDTRTFRDDLRPYGGQEVDTVAFHYDLGYWPYETGDSTMLGETQWAWLGKALEKPADLRIIGSSTQFGITYNGYEAWANFPHEQKRMLELIKAKKANGVVFISGDVHYAEVSKVDYPGLYPIYDVTSSGITSTWGFATPNDHRIQGPVMENHFGLLEIDWEKGQLRMKIIDVTGKERFTEVEAYDRLVKW
ncbi:MAG: alkaline phosphatase D family protein [Phaeodactylibacter sp.]|uniref:alkaline phosphatase D family protein n=1 Tax=Phaeodactylibacter sp. TaxID=1940289 RepID=UPI0032F06764